MNPRITIGFLVVLGVLGIVVYFTEFRSGTTPAAGPAAKEKEDPQLAVWTFDDKEVARFEVIKDEMASIVERETDDWVLQPSGEPAERFRVNSLLSRLSTLKGTKRVDDAGLDLGPFGLVTPQLSTRIVMKDLSLLELLVGAKTPAEAGTYVMKPGESTVYVIANTIVSDLERMVNEPPKAPATPTPWPSVTPTSEPGREDAAPPSGY